MATYVRIVFVVFAAFVALSFRYHYNSIRRNYYIKFQIKNIILLPFPVTPLRLVMINKQDGTYWYCASSNVKKLVIPDETNTALSLFIYRDFS